MKGVILAAGRGTRLFPITKVVNKEILPVYNKPMIYYPIETLRESEVKEILLVVGPGIGGQFLNLLGSGKELGVKIAYEVQEEQHGVADALAVAKDFADGGPIAVINADNIIEDIFPDVVRKFKEKKRGAVNAIVQVPDPERSGVVELDGDRVVGIEEKPKKPKSNWVSVGFYLFDSRVFDVIKDLKPSSRGEYEISDVVKFYISEGTLEAVKLRGRWIDAGTFDSLLEASLYAAKKSNK